MLGSKALNREFYDLLWSGSTLERPERFNTWQMISGLLPLATERLEIGPGLRPRLPVSGTHFLDISPPVAERLKASGGITTLGEITALPYGDGRFELVAAFDVVEHAEDERQIFAEISRVLKEGAVFIFSVPLHAASWTEFDRFVGHVRRYDLPDLLLLLAKNDLSIEKSAVYGMQPSNPRLLNLGLWWLKNRRREAMWWYNRILLPLGMFFQKRLKFGVGLIDTSAVDEIVIVCRKHGRATATGVNY